MTAPQFADPHDAHAYAAYIQAQREEYATYEAAADIRTGAVLAFRAGQAVPKSTAERMGWDRTGEVVLQHDADPEQLQARAAALREESDRIEAELERRRTADLEAGYGSLKVDEIRALLAERGLPTAGKKDELLARLHESDEADRSVEEQE